VGILLLQREKLELPTQQYLPFLAIFFYQVNHPSVQYVAEIAS
jgi:hypothetical protein